MNQGKCSTCGTSTGVKKDGDLWKHRTPDGDPCSGTSPLSDEPTPETSSIPSDSPEEVEEADAPSTQDDESDSVFRFEMSVADNSPYLGDKSWEACNKMVAYKKAKDAGLLPTGEPRLTRSETVGRKRVLVYEVPVE